MKVPVKGFMAGFVMFLVAAYSDTARVPEELTFGPNPILPEPNETLIPTVNIAPAQGWPTDGKPSATSGLSVIAYAAGLDHPRWLYVLPNGDVLVAETNGPPRPEDGRGIRGWIYQLVQRWVGAGVPSANRITLLRDADKDGVAQIRSIFLQDLNSPFGMALIGHDLYVANTGAVMRFGYADGDTVIRRLGVKVCDLPAGPLNHHWTKNLISSLNGEHLYVAVGSKSNAAENGLDKEDRRAGILEIDVGNGQSRVFASGLRNPVGMAWEPETGALWTVVNERDELGSDLVPDYLTSVKDGAFYGWPFSYYGQHVDDRVMPQRPDLVAKAVIPDYALGNPTASLGLVFSKETLLPERYRGGAFIGQHGSWNRKPLSGYKVSFVPFATQIAEEIRAKIRTETGLTASAGVSYNKFLAKLASDRRKPDGLFVITPKMGPAFVEALTVARFHGVGPVTAAKMNRLWIFTGADLKTQTQAFLQEQLGKAGLYYYWISRGIDDRPVCANRIRKSLGAEKTFSRDLTTLEDMQAALQPSVDKLWHHCEATAIWGRTVTLKVKYDDFQIITRCRSETDVVPDHGTLMRVSLDLLAPLCPVKKGVRLLGISLSSLRSESVDAPPQMTLAL